MWLQAGLGLYREKLPQRVISITTGSATLLLSGSGVFRFGTGERLHNSQHRERTQPLEKQGENIKKVSIHTIYIYLSVRYEFSTLIFPLNIPELFEQRLEK